MPSRPLCSSTAALHFPRASPTCWPRSHHTDTPGAMAQQSSGHGSGPADIRPCRERPRPCGTILDGGDVVATEVEGVADQVVGGEEALRPPRRLEPFHLPFSLSRRLMRILGTVVQPLVLPVLDAGHHLRLDRR